MVTVPRRMQLAPRSFNQVLAHGMNMLVTIWKSLLVPAFGAAIPLGALTLVAFRITGANDVLDLLFNDPDAFRALSEEEFVAQSTTLLTFFLIAVFIQLIASAFINLATHRIVGAKLADNPITGGEASRFAFTRLIPLLLAGLLAVVGVTIGLFLLVIPGIWLAVMLTMTPQVMALEDLGIIESLRRSFDLVRGHWWLTVGFLVLVGFLGNAAGQVVQLVALPLIAVGGVSGSIALAFVFGVLVQGLLISAIAVMTTFWYIDLRARKEPLLSESLG